MSLRFRRSIKVLPGIRVNFGKSGFTSVSVGPRGASLSTGRRGAFVNLGLPGTGLSYRSKLSGGEGGSSRTPDGLTAKERKEIIINDLQGKVERLNSIVEEGINQHRKIDPVPAIFEYRPWIENGKFSYPVAKWNIAVFAFGLVLLLLPKSLTTIGWLMVIGATVGAVAIYFYLRKKAKNKWLAQQASVQEFHDQRKALYRRVVGGEPNAIGEWLESIFDQMDWFLETSLNFEISDDGRILAVDVDLPEIEDIPDVTVYVKKTTQSVEKKARKDSSIRKDYLTHVHAIALRLAGEVFSQIPTIERVAVNGYTQRLDTASGHIQDDYVLSVIFDGSAWKKLNPALTDPVECMENFECRRQIQRNLLMKTIEPFTWDEIKTVP